MNGAVLNYEHCNIDHHDLQSDKPCELARTHNAAVVRLLLPDDRTV